MTEYVVLDRLDSGALQILRLVDRWARVRVTVDFSLMAGHFGTVYLARAKRAEDFLLVLKCLQKAHIEASACQTQVRREIEVG